MRGNLREERRARSLRDRIPLFFIWVGQKKQNL